MDPAGLSEDPGDMMGNDEPTEPPDKPKGTRRRESRQSIERVEEVQSRKAEVSRVSTDGAEATGDDVMPTSGGRADTTTKLAAARTCK